MRAKNQNKKKAPAIQPWLVAKKQYEALHATCQKMIKDNDEMGSLKNSLRQLKKMLEDLGSVRKALANEQEFSKVLATFVNEDVKRLLRQKQDFGLVDMDLDMIQICKLLQNRHKILALTEAPVVNYKKAIKYMDLAIEYRDRHIDFMKKRKAEADAPGEEYTCEQTLENDRETLKKMLEVHLPVQDSDSEIQVLKKQATLAENPEKAAELHRRAKTLAVKNNDYIAQFELLNDQLRHFYANNKVPDTNTEQYKIHSEKTAAFLMEMAALIIEDKFSVQEFQNTLRSVPVQLYNLAYNLEKHANTYGSRKDVEKKMNLLSDGYKYLMLSMELAKKINYTSNSNEVSKLHDEIIKQVMILQLPYDEKNEKKIAQKIALEQEEKNKENYNFPDILKKFPVKEHKKSLKNEEEIIWKEDDSSTSENDEPCNKIVAEPLFLDPRENLQLLALAKETNDVGNQIFMHTNVGEDHKKNAKIHFYKYNYNYCINELKSAIYHFNSAYQLIQKASLDSNNNHIQKEASLILLLEDTNWFLKKLIDKQKDIHNRFEKSRLEAKINMGPLWYENKNCIPSINAQIRMNAKNNLGILTEIQREFDATFSEKIGKKEPVILVSEQSMFLPQSNRVNKSTVVMNSPAIS